MSARPPLAAAAARTCSPSLPRSTGSSPSGQALPASALWPPGGSSTMDFDRATAATSTWTPNSSSSADALAITWFTNSLPTRPKPTMPRWSVGKPTAPLAAARRVQPRGQAREAARVPSRRRAAASAPKATAAVAVPSPRPSAGALVLLTASLLRSCELCLADRLTGASRRDGGSDATGSRSTKAIAILTGSVQKDPQGTLRWR
mmetsp:Transcript_24059/g.75944  ORF Transcript_24059/g.75944 Transcript_24059/m.75944 type:complete len:204 (+) Transcript_24059:1020-1631(+)